MKCFLKLIVSVCCFKEFVEVFFTDFKTWMAKKLGKLHSWHYWSVQDQRVSLPKQHDHSETFEWGSIWFLYGSNDSNESQTFKGHYVFAIFRSLYTLSICYGKLTEPAFSRCHFGDLTSILELDSLRYEKKASFFSIYVVRKTYLLLFITLQVISLRPVWFERSFSNFLMFPCFVTSHWNV